MPLIHNCLILEIRKRTFRGSDLSKVTKRTDFSLEARFYHTMGQSSWRIPIYVQVSCICQGELG